MKFSTIATASTIVAIASAVQLKAVTDNSELSGAGVASIHEGAAINYIRLSSGGGSENYTYDEAAGSLSLNLGGSIGNLELGYTSSGPYSILEFAPLTPTWKLSFDASGFLEANGSTSFYGCKNINDPYDYSTQSYFVVLSGSDLSQCIPIKLQTDNSSNTTTSAVPTEAPTNAPTGNSTTAVVNAAAPTAIMGAGVLGAAAMALLL